MTAFPPAVTDDHDAVPAPHFRESSDFLENADSRTASTAARDNLPIPWRPYAYTLDEVAALSAEKIFVMSRPELVGVIRSVRGGHLRPGVIERLPQMDGETLRRLVFLTRRFCRNQQCLAEPASSFAFIASCPR